LRPNHCPLRPDQAVMGGALSGRASENFKVKFAVRAGKFQQDLMTRTAELTTRIANTGGHGTLRMLNESKDWMSNGSS